MKIWIDAQLSPAIAAWINRTYQEIEAESVRAGGLRDALDHEIFEEARKQVPGTQNGFNADPAIQAFILIFFGK